MNVYAEVRGKYSRNPNNTNKTFEVPCVVSRPSTSGSLTNYTKRNFQTKINKPEKEEENYKTQRPLNREKIVTKKRKISDKGSEKDEKQLEEESDEKSAEKITENDEENAESEAEIKEDDQITEVSFKTTSSQKKYIEELEQLLREERMRRIKAEEKLRRLNSSEKQPN